MIHRVTAVSLRCALRSVSSLRTVVHPPVLSAPLLGARAYARARKPPPPPPQPDPITGFLPNSRKGTIQPNDQIDLFDWAAFRGWTTTETNGYNVAPRYIRDWLYFLPEVMTTAEAGKEERDLIPEKAKILGDPKYNKDFIRAGKFDEVPEEARPLFTALHNILNEGYKPEAKQHVSKFSEEILKYVDFPKDWTSETNKVINLQLGKTLVKGGDVDRIVFDGKGRIVMGMHEGVFDPAIQGYLDYGHHAIMGYSLAFTAHNYAIPPKEEVEQEQEQEVFFWNVKNHKITLIRVNARLPVLKQLKIGQCPQIRTALCVWPQVEGYDFLIPEERMEFFMKWNRVKKYLLSGKAFVGPKEVDPVEVARLAAEAAAEAEAAAKRKPTFLPPGAQMPPELLKAITPENRPDPNAAPATPAEADKKTAA